MLRELIKSKVLWQVFSLTNSRTRETPNIFTNKRINFTFATKSSKKNQRFFAVKSECWLWRKRSKMKQIYEVEKYSNLNDVKKKREKLNNKIISITTFQPISRRSVLLEWKVSLISLCFNKLKIKSSAMWSAKLWMIELKALNTKKPESQMFDEISVFEVLILGGVGIWRGIKNMVNSFLNFKDEDFYNFIFFYSKIKTVRPS